MLVPVPVYNTIQPFNWCLLLYISLYIYVLFCSEEVFDFSIGQMTQAKAKHLKDSMCSEFSQIFQLCQFVMDNSHNATLVAATLETLLRFLNWIPLGYIFETKLITTLIYKVNHLPLILQHNIFTSITAFKSNVLP